MRWLAALLPAFPAMALVAGEPPRVDDQKRLMANHQPTAGRADGKAAPPAVLVAELPRLWEAAAIGPPATDLERVFVETDTRAFPGLTVEGYYVNGVTTEQGTDRIFFYYSRPTHPSGKVPVFIELTGGAKDETANLWMASVLRCGVVHVEYRCNDARFRSQWAGIRGPDTATPSMQDMSSLRRNFLYRMIGGTRRVIDFLANREEVDATRIGCGGGSMGGYLTLLLAGVDRRIAFGVNELSGGWKSSPLGRFGNLAMSDEHKAIWNQAFNAYRFAQATDARIYTNLAANDLFFWLDDGLDNYSELSGEKRLGICANDNHSLASFGEEHFLPLFTWVPYCLGDDPDYPQITTCEGTGTRWRMKSTGVNAFRRVSLYWSPGKNVAWPARYWKEIPARAVADGYEAEIPAEHAGVARWTFMDVQDAKGRKVSSVPVFTPGDDPRTKAGPLWEDDQLWDTRHGRSAWRPVEGAVAGSPTRSAVDFEKPHRLLVGVAAGGEQFSIVTNSVILAAGSAAAHRGLEFTIDGRAAAGRLTIAILHDAGAVHTERQFSCAIDYEPGRKAYRIEWEQFVPDNPAGPVSPLGFDGLRLSGTRPEGSPLAIDAISFF